MASQKHGIDAERIDAEQQLEVLRAMDDDRFGDRQGTTGFVPPLQESGDTPVDSIGVPLNDVQKDRLKASLVYTESIRASSKDETDHQLSERIDDLGLLAVDPWLLADERFCDNKKLRALYALEICKLVGDLKARALYIEPDDNSYLSGAFYGTFIAMYDDKEGYGPQGRKPGELIVSNPPLIDVAKDIIAEYCGGSYTSDVSRAQKIRRDTGNIQPVFTVTQEHQEPYSVYLQDMNNTTQRAIGSIGLKEYGKEIE